MMAVENASAAFSSDVHIQRSYFSFFTVLKEHPSHQHALHPTLTLHLIHAQWEHVHRDNNQDLILTDNPGLHAFT